MLARKPKHKDLKRVKDVSNYLKQQYGIVPGTLLVYKKGALFFGHAGTTIDDNGVARPSESITGDFLGMYYPVRVPAGSALVFLGTYHDVVADTAVLRFLYGEKPIALRFLPKSTLRDFQKPTKWHIPSNEQ